MKQISEYLLLSDTEDKKPILVLPDAQDQKPMLSLPIDAKEEAKVQTRSPGVGYILLCDLPPSIPYRTPIQWYKNGASFSVPANSGRVSLTDNGRVLQFASLKREDAGLYTCVAGNNLALFTSRIIVAPRVKHGKIFIPEKNMEYYIHKITCPTCNCDVMYPLVGRQVEREGVM